MNSFTLPVYDWTPIYEIFRSKEKIGEIQISEVNGVKTYKVKIIKKCTHWHELTMGIQVEQSASARVKDFSDETKFSSNTEKARAAITLYTLHPKYRLIKVFTKFSSKDLKIVMKKLFERQLIIKDISTNEIISNESFLKRPHDGLSGNLKNKKPKTTIKI